MIDFVKSRLFLCLNEACMPCGPDDTDVLVLRDEQGNRHVDDSDSIEAARCQIISGQSAHHARPDYYLWRTHTTRPYGAAMQTMGMAPSGRIGRRLEEIERGTVGARLARYRLMQTGTPWVRRPDTTDGPRLGVQRLRYGGPP